MDEQFDNHVKDHIREVFENFEDPSADESWLLLREKFPEKEKNRGIIWLWLGTAAAVLLLLLGIGTWVNLQKNQPQKFSYKPVKTYHPENKLTRKDQQYSDKQQSILQHTDKNTAIAHKAVPGHQVQLTSPTHNNINPNNIKNNGSVAVVRKVLANPLTNSPSTNSPSTNNYTEKNLLADKPTDKTTASNTIAQNSSAIPKDTTIRSNAQVIADKLPAKPKMLPFSENEIPKERKASETNKKEDNNKKVEFSLYAATYFNYAKGSNSQLNVGAGITSDIKLTENLKLSTGIAIAQNSLSYANQLPEQAIQGGNLAAASTILYAGTSPATSTAFGASISPMLKNYNAQLIGLDIPMNLKYEFNPQKNNSYVSVGLSSGTFINEAYTYQYAYANAAGLAPAAQPQSQTTSSGFGNFYFAKTLNVSFGLGYPMGKTNHLVIEPFLKYPLEGLGSQQIRFGAGGVNLKFDFISSKK